MAVATKLAARVRPADVVESMRDDIFAGRLIPGDPLAELALARRFGVSQSVVREALARLEHAGLVRRFANRGTFVTNLSHTELQEYVRLRVMLEAVAASDAAARCHGNAESVVAAADAISRAVKANDYFGAAQADLEFHRSIWRMGGDTTIYRVLDQVTVPLFAFVSMRRSGSREQLRRVVHTHQPILEAILAGDRKAAASAMRDHISSSYPQTSLQI